jgi:hypothetical protein
MVVELAIDAEEAREVAYEAREERVRARQAGSEAMEES